MRPASIVCWLAFIGLLSGCSNRNAEEAKRELDLGRAAAINEDRDKAIEHFDRSIELNPTARAFEARSVAHHGLARPRYGILNTVHYELALKDVNKALDLYPTNSEYRPQLDLNQVKGGRLSGLFRAPSRRRRVKAPAVRCEVFRVVFSAWLVSFLPGALSRRGGPEHPDSGFVG